jgi:hypothetical protein
MPKDADAHDPLATRVRRLETQLAQLARAIRSFADEVRTRQLIVVDDEDRPRIVGEVFADVAELRLELPTVDGNEGPELLLFAVSRAHPGPIDLGPAVGLQLRAEGRAVFEMDAWPDTDGTWRPHLHLSGP